MTHGVVAAVDVGGSSVKGLLVDEAGRVVAARERPVRAGDPVDDVVASVRAGVAELVEAAGSADVLAIGLAVPGDVDAAAGIARYSANLGWRDVPVAAFIGDTAGHVPSVLDHDVRCAALAERMIGVTRGVADACVVVIGTGIASMSVAAGRTLAGARGLAGEIGHVPVHPGGEACACGQRGCLETYASAAAIARRYRALTGEAKAAHEIVAVATSGAGSDPAAEQVWGEAVAALGTACVTLTMLSDPTVIAFAGGLAEAGRALIDPLRAEVDRGLAWRSAPELVASPLGARAGRFGIALRAWQAAGADVDADAWAKHAGATS